MYFAWKQSANASLLKSVKNEGNLVPSRLPDFIQRQDLIEGLRSLKLKYDEEVNGVIQTKEQRKNEFKNLECNNNGRLKKEIRGNSESYYICRCEADFLGDNCQISQNLYQSTQKKLLDFLDEIQKQFAHPSRQNREKLLTGLILINKFKIGRILIQREIDIVSGYLEKDKVLENRKRLYVLYDTLLLNAFDLLEDLKKTSPEVYNADYGIANEREEIFKLINRLILMLEASLEDHVYLNSFLEKNASRYLGLDTFSFVISEYRMKNYDQNKGFSVHNANIDTSFNVIESNQIYFEFDSRPNQSDSFCNVQILVLASPLLENKLKEFGHLAVSNFVYLKYIDPQNPHRPIYHSNNKVKGFKIDFALLFIPAFDDILPNLMCLAYSFDARKAPIKGTVLKIDEDRLVLSCSFPANFEFSNSYFGVAMRK